MTKHYDVYIIGAGSGGVRAARRAAQCGLKVGIAENRHYGGTCVNVGCVPKKMLHYAACLAQDIGHGEALGIKAKAQIDWGRLIAHKNAEIERLQAVYGTILDRNGVECHSAGATFVDAHHLQVGDQLVEADTIIIASGSAPHRPDIVGIKHAIISDNVFYWPDLPSSIVILGGGYIGVEFASIFNSLGSKVSLVYRAKHPLRGFDHDLRVGLAASMTNCGIDLYPDTKTAAIIKDGESYIWKGDDDRIIRADQVMAALGRRPAVAELNLDKAGVGLGPSGGIMVDGDYRTLCPHIFAIGDVIDRVNLTPVAIAQAEYVVQVLTDQTRVPIDESQIPSAVFSEPPIATVGLTEAQARLEYDKIDVYRSTFTPLKYSLAKHAGDNQSVPHSLIKMVVEGKDKRVLGLHMFGLDAPEIMQGFAVALRLGLTKADCDQALGIHPTSAEEFVTLQ